MREIYNSPVLKLYEFSDAKRTNYFALENNGKFSELQFKAFYNRDDKPVYVRNYQVQLQGMLASLLVGRASLERKIFYVDYDGEDIVKYLDKVMNVKSATGKKAFRPEFAISVGGMANFFEIGPRQQTIPATRTKFDVKTAPLFSVSYIQYFQRNLGKVFLNPHLKYLSIEQVGIAPYEYINNLAYSPDTVTVYLKEINLDLFIGKSWIKTDNFSWYTSIGPSLHFFLENSYDERKPSGTSEKNSGKSFAMFFAAETGVVINKKIGLWVNYSGLPDVQNKVSYRFRSTNIQAGLQYRFRL